YLVTTRRARIIPRGLRRWIICLEKVDDQCEWSSHAPAILRACTDKSVRNFTMSSVNPIVSSNASRDTGIASAIQPFIPKSIVCLREGYGRQFFFNDVLAGITVGVIALPLAIAFAIGSHVRPEQGLYTAIVAGFLISLLGGSRVQIGGPTGAFVVIIAG